MRNSILGNAAFAASQKMQLARAGRYARAALFFLMAFIAFSVPIQVRASESFEEGIAAYRNTKYQKAVVIFRQAAERGDARAQEILGFMYLHGPSMYGAAVQQDRNQAIHWFGRAATGGREVAQHMLCVLNGRPGSTVVDRTSCVASASTASINARP